MYKIKVVSVGKTKETWLDAALGDYEKRLRPAARFEWVIAKDDLQLMQVVAKEKDLVCLDPAGQQLTSEEFSRYLLERLELGGARLTLIIGGPEGLPPTLKKLPSISLSSLTFTHQIVRLVLVEQIYRALEIAKGSPYHKG